jgi:hypothetical protein
MSPNLTSPGLLRSLSPSGLPPRPIALRVIRFAVFTWAVVRLTAMVIGIVGQPPVGTLLFSALVLALMWLDIRRRKERILYANLGIRPVMISIVVVVVAIVLETTLWMTIAAFAPDAPPEVDA